MFGYIEVMGRIYWKNGIVNIFLKKWDVTDRKEWNKRIKLGKMREKRV